MRHDEEITIPLGVTPVLNVTLSPHYSPIVFTARITLFIQMFFQPPAIPD